MARADGWTKNGKYSSLPEQMLCYRSATFLIRRYAPGILLGYRPTDELEDIEASRSSGPVYTDPEPASSPPRVSRAAPQPPQGSGEPVTRQGSSASAPGPKEGTSSPGGTPSSGPGVSSERLALEERVKELQSRHGALVKDAAAGLGLPSVKRSTDAQLASLIDAVADRLEREAIQDEDTQPEGAQP